MHPILLYEGLLLYRFYGLAIWCEWWRPPQFGAERKKRVRQLYMLKLWNFENIYLGDVVGECTETVVFVIRVKDSNEDLGRQAPPAGILLIQ